VRVRDSYVYCVRAGDHDDELLVFFFLLSAGVIVCLGVRLSFIGTLSFRGIYRQSVCTKKLF